MGTETIRRVAQVALLTIAIVTGAAAALSHFGGAPNPFGKRLSLTPSDGPVGIHPFFQTDGYGDEEVKVYLCANAADRIEDCVELGAGSNGRRVRANAIPATFPSGDEIVPAPYPVRVGPEDGRFPVRARFEVVAFEVGLRVRPRSLEGTQPQALRTGRPQEIARAVECRPPLHLSDGRLAIGQTVYDPATTVTIDLQLGVGVADIVWSPTGDKLAILTADRKEIRLAGPDGSGAVTSVREARGLLSSPSWSPDGDRLAFIAQNDPAVPRLGPGPPTVNILNATTGERTTAGPGLWVAWAPAGDAFAVQMSGSVIELGNPGGGRRRLVEGRRPAWSPDGRMLAFVRGNEGEAEGFISLADGTQAAPVTGTGTCGLSFTADAHALAAVEQRGDTTRMVLVPLE